MADQLDVVVHLATTAVTKMFDDKRDELMSWEPKPCPPPPERRNRWTRTSSQIKR